MYALDGSQPPDERQDPQLRGYRGSAPVRWGNGARHQLQHDVYGEIIDIAYQWSGSGKRVDPQLWAALTPIVEMAIKKWRVPDSGPWEIRGASRPFTYSAALCYVAIDRAIQIARRHGLPYPKRRWEATAREIRQAALTVCCSATSRRSLRMGSRGAKARSCSAVVDNLAGQGRRRRPTNSMSRCAAAPTR